MKGACAEHGCAIVDGDILVPITDNRRRNANNDANPRLWGDGKIEYSFARLPATISGNHFSLALRTAKQKIVSNMRTLTMLTFEEVPEDRARLLFVSPKSTECTATVGQPSTNAAEVHLGHAPNCWTDKTILHELLHVAGMQHEQSRQDRNEYLHVGNVVDEINNGISWINPLPFDFRSIMMYPLALVGETGASLTSKGSNRLKVQEISEESVGTVESLSQLNWELMHMWYEDNTKDAPQHATSDTVRLAIAFVAVLSSVSLFVVVAWMYRKRAKKVHRADLVSFF